jgi:hypothetical protein
MSASAARAPQHCMPNSTTLIAEVLVSQQHSSVWKLEMVESIHMMMGNVTALLFED